MKAEIGKTPEPVEDMQVFTIPDRGIVEIEKEKNKRKVC